MNAIKFPEGVPTGMELMLADGKRRKWVEGFTTPGALRPLVQFMGPAGGFAHDGDWYTTQIFPLFMGVCGDAFRFAWYRQDGEEWRHGDAWVISPPPQRYGAALDAAGFDCLVLIDPDLMQTDSPIPWNEDALRAQISRSIAIWKRPVLLADLPEPGWMTLITGYADNGKTLTGWCEEGWESFGFRFDPDKKRTFSDWFGKTSHVVLLTNTHPRPAETAVFRAALTRAVTELRRREIGHMHAGPATYEELAKRLGDPALSQEDEATTKKREGLLFPMIWDLATQRHYASEFLERSTEVFPQAAEELKAASDLFGATHDAVWKINRLGGGKSPGSPLPKTVDPAVRKQIADIVLECRDRDLEAARRIEAALRAVGVEPPAAPQAKAEPAEGHEHDSDETTPRFVEREAFDVVGIEAWLDMERDEDPGHVFANDLPPHKARIASLAVTPGWYAVYHARRSDGKVGCVVGVNAGRNSDVPEGLGKVTVPAARYAVFECDADEMGKTWGYIHGQWFPQSDEHRLGATPPFEFHYPPGEDEAKDRRAIWAPVVAKRAANSKE